MKKDFDAVEMKRQGQERLRQKLAGMTPEQVQAFWDQKTRELQERQRAAREQAARPDHRRSA